MTRRAAATLAIVVGLAALIASVVLFLVGVWVHGPDGQRWGNTGAILFVAGLVTTVLGGTIAGWSE